MTYEPLGRRATSTSAECFEMKSSTSSSPPGLSERGEGAVKDLRFGPICGHLREPPIRSSVEMFYSIDQPQKEDQLICMEAPVRRWRKMFNHHGLAVPWLKHFESTEQVTNYTKINRGIYGSGRRWCGYIMNVRVKCLS
jgi:hypothetical protein